MIQSPAWRLRQFPQTRVHSLLWIPRQKPCTRHRCCCRILHPTSGHQAQVAAGSLAAGPAPNVDGTSHVCGLCRPGLQCELRACITDCHSRTDHHCDAPGRVRCCSAPLLTDTAPVPALVEAPLDTDTPPVLPSSSSPDADSIRTSPLVLPMPPAPEDRVSDPPLTAEAGSREETGGFLVWFPYRWQHVHWAPVAPHRKR